MNVSRWSALAAVLVPLTAPLSQAADAPPVAGAVDDVVATAAAPAAPAKPDVAPEVKALAEATQRAGAAVPGTQTVQHGKPPRQARILLPETPLHPHAAAGLALRYAGTPVDVRAYHYDDARTGWNPAETALTVASVQSPAFGLLATLAVDGDVFAQPLLVSNQKMADGTVHDVLVVATMNNSVYAFDARTYTQLWKINTGTPQNQADVGCDDVIPQYGIAATPVIIRNGGKSVLYFVDAVEPTASDFHTRLHQVNVANGRDIHAPMEISPTATMSDGHVMTMDKQNQWARAGLVASRGSIYVSIGSHCDHNPVYASGWVLRYSAKNLAPLAAFNLIDTPAGTDLADIWGGGFAPAVDAAGNFWGVTGNGDVNPTLGNWGESVIKMPPTLAKVADWFTPGDYQALNDRDRDFGAGGVTLLPVLPGQTLPPMAVAMGKIGKVFLLNRSALGHMDPNDAGALATVQLGTPGWNFQGGPGYWTSPTGDGEVFLQIKGDVLRGFTVPRTGAAALVPAGQGTTLGSMGGSIPIVSSNGSMPGTGVVWVVQRNPLVLEAYDAEHLGAPIYSATAGAFTAGQPFLSAVAANGRVYVAASGTVKVFGLTP